MQLAISLSFVKLLWPLVRFISYSHDQDHVHISTTCYSSTLEVSNTSIHPQNKTPCLRMTPLSLKNASKDMGLCKNKNKRCIPKEGMPHASTCQKKEIKDAYPKKVCHMLRQCTRKRQWPEVARWGRPNPDEHMSRCLAGRLILSSWWWFGMFPCMKMAGTDLHKLYKGPLIPLTTHTTWRPLSHTLLWLILLRVVELG